MGELRLVDPPADMAVRSVWADPRSIRTNPDNPFDHPPEQTEAVEGFIREHGWLQPLLFNSRSGHLVDGHDRIGIAILNGWPAVPVWIGDWNEDEEARIILALRESGRMALYNAQKSRQWLQRLDGAKGRVEDMIAAVRAREGLQGAVDGKADGPDSKPCTVPWSSPEKSGSVEEPQDTRAVDLAKEAEQYRASNVRLVQLLLSRAQLETFNEQCDVLRDHWRVESATDVVVRALDQAFGRYLGGEV